MYIAFAKMTALKKKSACSEWIQCFGCRFPMSFVREPDKDNDVKEEERPGEKEEEVVFSSSLLD